MPAFAGATEWLNSEPPGPAGLRVHIRERTLKIAFLDPGAEARASTFG